MPGSLASSAASSSMTDNRVSDRKLEWEREASSRLAQLFLVHLARAALGVTDRRQYEILEHLGIAPAQHAGIDLDAADLPPPIHRGLDHPASGRPGDHTLGQ